jgi:hypothetical protein
MWLTRLIFQRVALAPGFCSTICENYQMIRIKPLVVIYLIFLIGVSACSSPIQTSQVVSNNTGSEPTRVVVRILNLDLALTALPTQTPVPPSATPEPVIIPSATPPPSVASQNATLTPTPSCFNRAEFVKHLTISDNTAMEAGQNFTKEWRIKNTGTCIWTTDYTLVFFSGEEMGAPPTISLTNPVQPGETIDLQVAMVAPLNAVTVTGNWVLKDANGNIFGFGETADRPIEVTIFVKPTPRPTPG